MLSQGQYINIPHLNEMSKPGTKGYDLLTNKETCQMAETAAKLVMNWAKKCNCDTRACYDRIVVIMSVLAE
eukprot:10919662-Ditylum_brightwellii.AAC.1